MKLHKKIFKSLAKKFILWGLRWIYKYADKDKDGKLSKQELKALYNDLKSGFKKIGIILYNKKK